MNEIIPVYHVSDGNCFDIGFEDFSGYDLLHQGLERYHDYGLLSHDEAAKNFHAGQFHILLKSQHVRGKKIPRRIQERLIFAAYEKGNVLVDIPGFLLRGGDHDQCPVNLSGD